LFHLIKYKQWRCCIYTLVIFIVVGLYHIKLLKKKEVLFRKATYNIYKDITLIMSFGLVGTNCSARNFKRVFSGSSFKIYLFILQIAQLNKYFFLKKMKNCVPRNSAIFNNKLFFSTPSVLKFGINEYCAPSSTVTFIIFLNIRKCCTTPNSTIFIFFFSELRTWK